MTSPVLTNPVTVLTIRVPGSQGPGGIQGPPGPPNSLSIGTVATGAVGSQASGTVTGTAPTQQLNLTIPRGDVGPANVLSIGTITTGAAGSSASGSITGTAPNQTLNLTIPRGDTGATAVDATTSSKGSIQLAGDLGGTAASPTVNAVSTATANTLVRRDGNADISLRKLFASSVEVNTPTSAQEATRKDYVDNLVAARLPLSGGTMTGDLNVPSHSSVNASSNNNTALSPTKATLAAAPFAAELWHDLLAFGRHLGAPTYETTANGTTWNSAAALNSVFARREVTGLVQIFDGTSIVGARWTWNSNNFQYSNAQWVTMGFGYNGTSTAKNVLVEISTNGTAWTTVHSSSANWNAQPAWFSMSSPGAESYLRITITSSSPVTISSIRVLSNRWANQGGGSEYHFPYNWDYDQNVTFVKAFAQNAPSANNELTRKDYVDGQVATRAATSHTHTASQISDSSTVGRSLIVATDAPTARSAIGAGTSSLVLGTTSTTAKAGDYVPTKADVGLGNVDNTSDMNKPVSTSQAAALTAFGRDRGSGTSLPSTDLRRGDVYYHTGWTCIFMYNGSAWRQMYVPDIATIAARSSADSSFGAAKHAGFQIMLVGLKTVMTWDGSGWRFLLTNDTAGNPGPQVSTDTNGLVAITHGGGATPLAYGAAISESSTDSQNGVLKWVNFGKDGTSLTFRAVRTDSSAYLNNPSLGINWWARF